MTLDPHVHCGMCRRLIARTKVGLDGKVEDVGTRGLERNIMVMTAKGPSVAKETQPCCEDCFAALAKGERDQMARRIIVPSPDARF